LEEERFLFAQWDLPTNIVHARFSLKTAGILKNIGEIEKVMPKHPRYLDFSSKNSTTLLIWSK